MEERKYYVYELIDPKTKVPFYVGKGQGTRCDIYFKTDPYITRATQVVLDEIQLRGEQVKCAIVKNTLTELEALELEALLIKKYGRRTKDVGGLLTNIQSRGVRGRGIKYPGKEYATIQIETAIKNQIVDYCDESGMKIGRFVAKLFMEYISGSRVETNEFVAQLISPQSGSL
jgi:hypothetical protein